MRTFPAKYIALLLFCLPLFEARATPAHSKSPGLSAQEEQRRKHLLEQLCATRRLSCPYVITVLSDPRLVIGTPIESPSQKLPSSQAEREPNPYLTVRFGLLTDESMERCRTFIQTHAVSFDSVLQTYRVPREIICGILRIESDFGIPTKLSPHPLGTTPAINRLATLYVRRSPSERSLRHFIRRQKFALEELEELLSAASRFDWDVFEIPGSPTGAIGLAQFEPSSLQLAVDGNGDGKIDLFDPSDAIPSVANYLVNHGWDAEPQHQRRAIYSYYGGNYDADRNKYYMKAVLKYADQVRAYLKEHPVESNTMSASGPF